MTSLRKNVGTSQMDFFYIKFISYLAIFAQVSLQNSSHEYVQFRDDHIIKSPNDERLYRGLVLKNEMKILLISDPTTDKSAASLNVNVGSMSDPLKLPGLAHFCEHMLFLGTKKYPKENDFDKYISQNSGSSNAFTNNDNTNYLFDTNSQNLEGALDRFAQFFLEPLFNESNIQREIRAVNSEFELILNNDVNRLLQFDKSSADPKHPYFRFTIGNKETLEIIPDQENINVREELLNFHKKWYSANIMALSVLGRESLDDLEKMVVEIFAKVENKNTEVEKWTYPFNEEYFKHKWYIVPVKDIRKLIILFPLPDLQNHFRSEPAYYLSYLLENKGNGSLLSDLKEKSWSDSLQCKAETIAKGIYVFKIEIDLTEEGLNHTDEIITLIFQYINMIKTQGPMERIFKEYQNIQNISFRFQEKYNPYSYVESTSQALQNYPFKEVLRGSHVYTEWRPDLINMVMGYLSPENIRVQIVAQIFKNITTEFEPWFQTKFKKEKIPASVIGKWKNAGINSNLQFPDKNEFIPSTFDLKQGNIKIDKFPIIIKKTPIMKVWFKQDDKFLLPQATLMFHFVSPFAYIDAESYNKLHMFVKLLEDSLSGYTFAAGLSGLEWHLTTTNYGIKLSIGGYDDKQFILLKKILHKMKSLNIDEKRFKILKENYIRELENFNTTEPYQLVQYYIEALLSQKFWVKHDLLNASSQLTVESMRNFIPRLFKKMHVECLMYGNVRKDEALEIASFVELKLSSKNDFNEVNIIPLMPEELALSRAVNLKQGYHYLYEIQSPSNNSLATFVYYQIGLYSMESYVLVMLFIQIIAEPSYTILRTNEQLGYIVLLRLVKQNGALGLGIIVEGEKHPQNVEERINAFMNSMEHNIQNMLDEEFKKHKESVIGRMSEKPKTISGLSGVFWNEISSQMYNFNSTVIEVAYLRTITKDHLLQFYKEFIRDGSSLQKKLSIHVISKDSKVNMETIDIKKHKEKQLILIENIDTFKASQSFYPRSFV